MDDLTKGEYITMSLWSLSLLASYVVEMGGWEGDRVCVRASFATSFTNSKDILSRLIRGILYVASPPFPSPPCPVMEQACYPIPLVPTLTFPAVMTGQCDLFMTETTYSEE